MRAISTKIKDAKGTLNKGKKSFIEDEPAPQIVEFSPAPPDNLNEDGKVIWDNLVPKLVSLQIFTNIDHKLFANYCNEQGLYEKAHKELEENGYVAIFGKNDYPMPSPWVAIKNKALANATKLSTEFGLTPASRTRISVGASKPVGKRAQILKKVNE